MQLANVLSTEGLFYACIIPFIIFFGSFAFVLYPLRDIIHPTGEPHTQHPKTPTETTLAHEPCMSIPAGELPVCMSHGVESLTAFMQMTLSQGT